MRLPYPPLPTLRRLALTSTLLAAGGLAQAAGLQLSQGFVGGGWLAQTGANGQLRSSSADLVDVSGPGLLLGSGTLVETFDLSGAGQTTSLARLWSGRASLDASDASRLQFQIDATSVLGLDGGAFDGGHDTTSLVLDSEVTVISTGEAIGTPVRLRLTGRADSVVTSSGPALDSVPTFNLAVLDAHSGILLGWQGLDAGSSASFSLSLDTRVGDSLHFNLSHGNTSLLGAAAGVAATGGSLHVGAMLTGSLQVTPVPEPESMALFLAGLAGLGLLHSRQRARRD